MESIFISEELYGRATSHLADDDLVDRLNNRYTVMMLMACSFVIVGGIFVGNPINCWAPAEFSDQHVGYAESICWLQGSYYLPTEEITIPDRSKPRHYFVSYYQWTPFILLGMGLLFLFPKFVWHTFARQAGLNIRRLVQTIKNQPDSDKGVDFAKDALKDYLDRVNRLHGANCCGLRCNNFYLGYTLTYFLVKLLYIVNTLAQFFLLNAFLSFQFTGYGVEALNKMFSGSGDDWFESPRFPRVTMCDFMIRHLGSNQHWYAIQCNLPINLYNEKIFLGVWMWLLMLTALNVASTVTWIVSLTRSRQLATVRRYLEVEQSKGRSDSSSTTAWQPSAEQGETFSHFLNYLHTDGFLIFRIFTRNISETAAGQIIEHLYRNFETPTAHYTSDV